MSLKAKIEAVIYAAEEPVTLAQLTGLLGEEAQAELDRRDAAQQTLALDTTDDPEEVSPEAGILAESDVYFAEDGDMTAAIGPGGPEANTEAAAEAPAQADEKKAAREEKARVQRLREHFHRLLNEVVADYADGDRGLEIREVAGGYRLATKPEYHDAVRGFVKSLKPPLKLTLQALETLAVVAYKQPVTAPEISEIRGVDSGGVLGSLMARKLITTAGRKQVIGRPILYKTTRDFLLRFGLKDVAELPSIEEFERMAGELAEDPVQEEISMKEASVTEANLQEEKDAIQPQADGDSSELVPLDGRLSGAPPAYDQGETNTESPAHDAEVQADTDSHLEHSALGRNQ